MDPEDFFLLYHQENDEAEEEGWALLYADHISGQMETLEKEVEDEVDKG